MPLEHAVLLGGGEPCVQGDDIDTVPAPRHSFEDLGGVADLALPGQEDEDVAGSLEDELLARRDDRLGLVAVAGVRPVRVDDGGVAHLHRVRAARDLDHGRVVEVP